MKKLSYILLTSLLLVSGQAMAQCSLCTKTAQQLGEGPAKGLNNGIMMLMIVPLALIALLGYRWWKSQRVESQP
ncbi:hypothetical protein ACWKWU_06900 [Chitinophaga lutea]